MRYATLGNGGRAKAAHAELCATHGELYEGETRETLGSNGIERNARVRSDRQSLDPTTGAPHIAIDLARPKLHLGAHLPTENRCTRPTTRARPE